MKSREEFIEEAQELLEALDFGEYTVEGVDNWNFDFFKMGPIVAETTLTVYLSHPEDEPDSPSSKASVTVTFDSTNSLPLEAYCINNYGDTICEIDPAVYRKEKEFAKLNSELTTNLKDKGKKIKL